MRQAGILAAAGLVAIREMPGRLHEDHARAAELARGLAAVPGFRVDLESVQTNMVYVNVNDAPAVAAALKRDSAVLCSALAHDRLRFVTHYMTDDAMVGRAISAAEQVTVNA